MLRKRLTMLLLAGFAAAGGQFTITFAYFYAPAGEISIYDYTQILFATLWSLVIFSQVPDLFSILGYLIICTAAVVNFLLAQRQTRRKKNS